ncbi:MAG: winged helix-turn-helix transcriptional regulator [Butyrivibrio sp.]|nr:winged helix-turn-helix transcriptional regulator [Butyrivibrio sp.]
MEYSLSKLGRKLTPALDTLGEWGHQVWLANGKPGDKKD